MLPKVVFVAASALPVSAALPSYDAVARPEEVDHPEPDEQRDRGDDLEIDETAQCQATDPLDVIAMSRNADDQGAEDQRHHDRLDQLDEDRRDRREIWRQRDVGPDAVVEPADDDADHHRNDDPAGERNLPQCCEHAGSWREGSGGQGGHLLGHPIEQGVPAGSELGHTIGLEEGGAFGERSHVERFVRGKQPESGRLRRRRDADLGQRRDRSTPRRVSGGTVLTVLGAISAST